MARAFKPHVHINNSTIVYHRYSEVKKDMTKLLERSETKEISVSRHRRGEWGEWYETWGFNHERKPFIIKEGWM